MANILIVEDDKDIVTNLAAFLRSEGFSADSAAEPGEAVRKMKEQQFDLLLLDVSLQNGNGFALCREIREYSDVPIIFLTASGDEFSVVTGFELGADDYINKPFRPRELVSRINNVLRRRGGPQTQQIAYEGVCVDPVRAAVYKNGNEIFLSALEYRLLLVFFQHKGAVLSRTKLLEEIWDAAGDFVNDNTLTVYIKRLRDKIEDDPQNPTIIKTVRGIGYKI